nr:hypothetical protein [Tanacetum cinerariifolium]
MMQYTRRARIAQSSALLPVADEPASPVRDVSEGEACPTDSGFIADQGRATIAKSSTLPHDTAPRVTFPAAIEGKDNQGVIGARSANDAPIKGRRRDKEEGITRRVSSDTEEIRMDEGEGELMFPLIVIPFPLLVPLLDTVSTASLIIATATVVTPYSRRKGKEVMVEFDIPKKQRLQEQIDAQVARELEEQQERED